MILVFEKKEPSDFLIGVLCVTSFIGAQRFLLTPIDSIACIVPLIFVFFYYKVTELRNTLILFSLFISVDNAPYDLTITFSYLRYFVYFFAMLILYSYKNYNPKSVLTFSIVFILLVCWSIFNYESIHLNTFIRDLFIVALIYPVLCLNGKFDFQINFSLLNKLIIIYIISEVINVFIRAKLGFTSADYLSYNSTKSLIIAPTFYYLVKNKINIAIPLILLTFFVLVAYGTRMIIITYVIGLILFFFTSSIFSLKFFYFIFIILITFYLSLNVLFIDFSSFKATGVFVQLIEEGDFYEKILLIDPVRYYETKMFFDRNFFKIIFGSGFGSGLIDVNNYLGFVKSTDTAFTIQELNSGKYYNLHDTWIDLGLRFGFIAILLVYFFIFKLMISFNNHNIKFIGFSLLVLFSCATYSTQGLILICYLFFYAKANLKNRTENISF